MYIYIYIHTKPSEKRLPIYYYILYIYIWLACVLHLVFSVVTEFIYHNNKHVKQFFPFFSSLSPFVFKSYKCLCGWYGTYYAMWRVRQFLYINVCLVLTNTSLCPSNSIWNGATIPVTMATTYHWCFVFRRINLAISASLYVMFPRPENWQLSFWKPRISKRWMSEVSQVLCNIFYIILCRQGFLNIYIELCGKLCRPGLWHNYSSSYIGNLVNI